MATTQTTDVAERPNEQVRALTWPDLMRLNDRINELLIAGLPAPKWLRVQRDALMDVLRKHPHVRSPAAVS